MTFLCRIYSWQIWKENNYDCKLLLINLSFLFQGGHGRLIVCLFVTNFCLQLNTLFLQLINFTLVFLKISTCIYTTLIFVEVNDYLHSGHPLLNISKLPHTHPRCFSLRQEISLFHKGVIRIIPFILGLRYNHKKKMM